MQHALEQHRSQDSTSSSELSPIDNIPLESEQQSTRAVPGETYIGSHEKAGLPQISVKEYSTHQATRVVQTHKPGFLRRLRQRARIDTDRGRRNKTGDTPNTKVTVEIDVERNAEAHAAAPRRKPANGILSTLLTLYNTSSAALETSTPTSRRSSQDFRTTPSPGVEQTESTTSTLTVPQVKKTSWAKGFSSSGRSSRPSSARSDAGVFGALVASTGNLSGPAAPAPSSLAPSVKRPGYRLSRSVFMTSVC